MEVKNVSHKATDVGEMNQGKNMLGRNERAKLPGTPTFSGWREEKAPGNEVGNQDRSGKKAKGRDGFQEKNDQ